MIHRTLSTGEQAFVGTLAQNRQGVFFQYDAGYLTQFGNLSPFTLKPNSSLQLAPKQPHHGLHGVFADSLPDGWGLLHKFLFFPLWERSCVLSHEFPIMGIRAITGIALSRLTAH